MFRYDFSVIAQFDARVYSVWTYWVLSSVFDHCIQSSVRGRGIGFQVRVPGRNQLGGAGAAFFHLFDLS